MKFVPVAGTQVLFSVWDTRVQDFEAFVADTNYDATGYSLGEDGLKRRAATWREPGFSQGPTHPVVGVSWNDAKKFCEWLTAREQGSGMLPRGRVYRLPTDAEWSAGVGLQGEEGNNPKEKDGKIKLYPWGKELPPPRREHCFHDKFLSRVFASFPLSAFWVFGTIKSIRIRESCKLIRIVG